VRLMLCCCNRVDWQEGIIDKIRTPSLIFFFLFFEVKIVRCDIINLIQEVSLRFNALRHLWINLLMSWPRDHGLFSLLLLGSVVLALFIGQVHFEGAHPIQSLASILVIVIQQVVF